MQAARKADLYSYLVRYHDNNFKHVGNSLQLKNNRSLSIKRGYSGYNDFATNETGNSVDFLVRHMGYQLTQAVFALCGETSTVTNTHIYNDYTVAAKVPPLFPSPTSGKYDRLYAYLMKRGISPNTIAMLIERKLLYQECLHNNVVFINAERDWAEIRGTNTYADKNCKHRYSCEDYSCGERQWCTKMAECKSYKKDAFHGAIKDCRKDGFWRFETGQNPEIAFVCEAAIDAISLYELHKTNAANNNAAYVSIGGVSKQETINRLKENYKIILAVDNDEAGSACRARNPELNCIIPTLKDWNEDLLHRISAPYFPREMQEKSI